MTLLRCPARAEWLVRVICGAQHRGADHIHSVVCHWVALMLASKNLLMIQGAANARFWVPAYALCNSVRESSLISALQLHISIFLALICGHSV
jgi:hypothetical protein